MHECLLFATIPSTQHTHILQILAGISAMQPLPQRNCHLLFKPHRTPAALPTSIPGRPPPTSTNKPGSTNPFASTAAAGQLNNELFYLQLVGDLTRTRTLRDTALDTALDAVLDAANGGSGDLQDGDEMDIDSAEQRGSAISGAGAGAGAGAGSAEKDDEARLWASHSWTLNYAAVPDVPGKRTATSRLISTIPLLDGNPREFLHGLGYAYVSGYLVDGFRFTHNHLSVTLCRTVLLPENGKGAEIPVERILGLARMGGSSGGDADDGLGDLQLLDVSGGYLLQVSARVSDGSKPELMNKAFAELATFRDLLRGVVSLQPVERLGLDTRVRSDRAVQATAQTQIRSAAIVR